MMRQRTLYVVSGLALLAAGCAATAEGDRTQVAPAFDVAGFFTGASRGEGALTYRSGRVDQTFSVISDGRWNDDGDFILRQIIDWSDGDRQLSTFVLTPEGEGRFKGHFAGSDDPVRLWVEGDAAYLEHGLPGLPMGHIRQEMVPSADGRTLDNRGTVRVLGMPVRRLEETIEKRGE